VKEFNRPAPNQKTVLNTFQEDAWPPRVDDPIPPEPARESRERLHETIRRLNGCQKRPLIRFRSDGSDCAGASVGLSPIPFVPLGATGRALRGSIPCLRNLAG
jgi:hypothetical protein